MSKTFHQQRTVLIRLARLKGMLARPHPLKALAGEMEVSTKTIYRDIVFCRDNLGWKVRWKFRSAPYRSGGDEVVWQFEEIPKAIL